jgi:hypothetical protein
MVDKVKQGKRNQINGRDFENRVRKDLESKGWIINRWNNNVELESIAESVRKQIELTGSGWLNGRVGKLIPAKQGYYRKTSTGFPDFIAYKISRYEKNSYQILGIECKTNGYLDKTEREKCEWLLKNKIFNEIVIAKKIKEKNRIKIDYISLWEQQDL